MTDLQILLIGIACIVTSGALVALCERIRR